MVVYCPVFVRQVVNITNGLDIHLDINVLRIVHLHVHRLRFVDLYVHRLRLVDLYVHRLRLVDLYVHRLRFVDLYVHRLRFVDLDVHRLRFYCLNVDLDVFVFWQVGHCLVELVLLDGERDNGLFAFGNLTLHDVELTGSSVNLFL